MLGVGTEAGGAPRARAGAQARAAAFDILVRRERKKFRSSIHLPVRRKKVYRKWQHKYDKKDIARFVANLA